MAHKVHETGCESHISNFIDVVFQYMCASGMLKLSCGNRTVLTSTDRSNDWNLLFVLLCTIVSSTR